MKRAGPFLLVAACSATRTATRPATTTTSTPPAPTTDAQVRVETATFTRGRTDGRPDEAPPHDVEVHAFYMDTTLVTRAAFARFADETKYVTTAERLGYGVASEEGMDDWAWQRVPHASFRAPFIEKNADTESFLRDDAPVVMVSFSDADAYCRHAGKRLPSEAEWELAMRAGAKGTRYPWGESPERAPGTMGLNFWQGVSHHKNLRSDGWVYVSPVRAFPPNAFGIHDPVGNVWQWTSDYYASDTYAALAKGGVAHDPKGPPSGKERVLRGGSWWCGACTCEGNGLYYRGHAVPDAVFNNNGFRCAKSAD